MIFPPDFLRIFDSFTHPRECGAQAVRLGTCKVTSLVGDRGGRTIHGIAETFHPEAFADGKIPTVEDAKQILYQSYWTTCHCQAFVWPLNAVIFDFAMNHGEDDPAYTLQVLSGHAVESDGDIGPKTVGWVHEWMARSAALNLLEQREILGVRTRWKAGLLARCAALRQLVLTPK